MKKIAVVSGATGMTGSETVRRLLVRGYEVVAFDNFFASSIDSLSDVLGNGNLTFFKYDLNEPDEMQKLDAFLRNKRARDLVEMSFIHCAAVVHTRHFYEPEATFTTNVLGMRSLMAMAIGLGAQKFLNCSTSEVYSLSSFKENGVCENDPLMFATAETSQRTSYATGKLLTEFFLKAAVDNGRIRGCSIRFANVYSNDELLPEHIIPHIIDSLLGGNTVRLLNNARNTRRTFLHNVDSCAAVLALLENEAVLDGTVYNVGTDEEISIPDLVKLIARKLERSAVEILYEGERSADPQRRLLNTDKIRAKTGWRPEINLNAGLDMCIEFRRRARC